MPQSPRSSADDSNDIFALFGTDAVSPIGQEAAQAALMAHYGLNDDLRLLTGERDENFLLKTADGQAWIFKIFGAAEDIGEADMLAAILLHLESVAPDLPVPRLRANLKGDKATVFSDHAGKQRQCILYSFLPGRPLFEAPRSLEQQRQCGTLLARTAMALKSFAHPRMHRQLIWDLKHLTKLRALLPQIADLAFSPFVTDFLDAFAEQAEPRLASVPHQFVHHDFNARNIIVSAQDDRVVTGIIDFGDAVFSARVADIAVGVIGQLATPQTARSAMDEFVAAYHQTSPLEESELSLLPWMVAGRIVQNLVLTSWYRARSPEGAHFAGFDADFFAWRIDFARQLCSDALRV